MPWGKLNWESRSPHIGFLFISHGSDGPIRICSCIPTWERYNSVKFFTCSRFPLEVSRPLSQFANFEVLYLAKQNHGKGREFIHYF